MAPLALMLAGSPAQQKRWLPKLAAGEARASVAVSEHAGGARENAGVTANGGQALRQGAVRDRRAGADILIVADRDRRPAPGGGERERPDDARAADHRSHARRWRAGVRRRRGRAARVATEAVIARLLRRGRVMLAADTLGAGWAMIDKAVAYAKERRQFGRIIASYQAVKHLCAEMAAQLEPGRALVWYAAYAFDQRPDEAPLIAAHAKALSRRDRPLRRAHLDRGARRHRHHRHARPALLVQAHRRQPPAARQPRTHARARRADPWVCVVSASQL